jgi:HlyD family secretion protein
VKLARGPLLIGAAVLAAAVVSLLALRPKPVAVESAPVHFGPLEVTVEDQAETRSHDRYVVAAPVAGRLLRVLLRDGDAVTAGEAVATLAPVPLSAREHDEAIARVDAAEATEKSEQAQLQHAREDLAQAQRDLTRLQRLAADGLASKQALDQARTAVATLGLEVSAARHRGESASAQLRGAKAALAAVTQIRSGHAATLTVHAPAAGRVLRVLEPSERVIGSGTSIMVIGDLAHLEVVAEMLTSQAVLVTPGMPALLLDWGGDQPLRARVQRVEPYGYTKISALGVEEKRSNVILDFVDPPGPLGDGYRVIARIIVWRSAHVLQAPLSAIFRCDSREWCAYVIDHGRAQMRHIRIGHRNDEAAQILDGLKVGERVITHPPNELSDGARVSVKPP